MWPFPKKKKVVPALADATPPTAACKTCGHIVELAKLKKVKIERTVSLSTLYGYSEPSTEYYCVICSPPYDVKQNAYGVMHYWIDVPQHLEEVNVDGTPWVDPMKTAIKIEQDKLKQDVLDGQKLVKKQPKTKATK